MAWIIAGLITGFVLAELSGCGEVIITGAADLGAQIDDLADMNATAE